MVKHVRLKQQRSLKISRGKEDKNDTLRNLYWFADRIWESLGVDIDTINIDMLDPWSIKVILIMIIW